MSDIDTSNSQLAGARGDARPGTPPGPEAAAPPPARSFEEMLADPHEQFDGRSELLASIASYAAAPPASAGIQPPEAAAATPGRAAWEARHLAVFGVAAPDWAWGQLSATERTGMEAAAQAVLDRAFPGLKRERDGLHADRKRLTTALADMTEDRDAIKDERDQLHGELAAARKHLGDTGAERNKLVLALDAIASGTDADPVATARAALGWHGHAETRDGG